MTSTEHSASQGTDARGSARAAAGGRAVKDGGADAHAGVADALTQAREALERALALVADEAAAAMSEDALMEAQSGTVTVKHAADLVMAATSAEIARRSSVELGSTGLARRRGFTEPTQLIAAETGGSRREADRLIRAGRTLAEAGEQARREERARQSGIEEPASTEPTYPHVAAALSAGRLSVDAAAQITRMLDSVVSGTSVEQRALAERRLVDRAPGLSAEQFSRIVTRWRDSLVERDAEKRQRRLAKERYLVLKDDPDGSVRVTGRLDPASAAPLRAALDASVKDALRRRRDGDPLATDGRMPGQMRADALVTFARHMLGCEQAPTAHTTTTVVVRMTLDQLRREATGSDGVVEVDGAATAVPPSEARRLAVNAGYLPVVLGGEGQVLDVGRAKRLFSRSQCVALLERDGGCAMCGAPPSHCEAHHIEWWDRDGGRTDLSNGVMLCVACHHTVHRDRWEIEATAQQVWFRPPESVDPGRRRRRGGRARFGITDRERAELRAAGADGVPPTRGDPNAATPEDGASDDRPGRERSGDRSRRLREPAAAP